jgi:hypothetical protein
MLSQLRSNLGYSNCKLCKIDTQIMLITSVIIGTDPPSNFVDSATAL